MVVTLTGYFGKTEAQEIVEALKWFPLNFLFMAIPYVVWLGLAKAFRAPSTVAHLGFVGAHGALFTIGAIIYTADRGHLGNAWFLYIPIATVLMLIAVAIGYAAVRVVERKRA